MLLKSVVNEGIDKVVQVVSHCSSSFLFFSSHLYGCIHKVNAGYNPSLGSDEMYC